MEAGKPAHAAGMTGKQANTMPRRMIQRGNKKRKRRNTELPH